MKRIGLLGAVLSATLWASTASAAIIIDFVGDLDDLGGAIAPAATSFPSTPFDNRSGAEVAGTDGSQWTDWSNGPFGIDLPGPEFLGNPTFVHSFAAFSSITSAVWEIGVGGIQSRNDRLFLDGVLIASGTDFPEQGSNGYGLVSFAIPVASLADLLDGLASFRVNLNSNDNGEPVVFDFARLRIEGTPADTPVPEPVSLLLMGGGLAVAIGRRLRRTTNN